MPESLLRRVRESSQPVEQPILDALRSALSDPHSSMLSYSPPSPFAPLPSPSDATPSRPRISFAAPADAAGVAHTQPTGATRGTDK